MCHSADKNLWIDFGLEKGWVMTLYPVPSLLLDPPWHVPLKGLLINTLQDKGGLILRENTEYDLRKINLFSKSLYLE